MNPRQVTRRTRPSRRDFLVAGGAGLTFSALSACSFFSTGPDKDSDSKGRPGTDLKESPDLAERVKAGQLPALEDRLPANPVVVEPTDRTGTYGGTWNTALLGPEDQAWLERTVGYEPVLRWNVEWTEAIPNVAESVEQSPEGNEFIIRLRDGLKWSDGEPFTADDIVFAYENVLLNPKLMPVTPTFLTNGGETAKLRKTDDVTIEITFAKPNGLFLEQLALLGDGEDLITYPRHYLEAFHQDFAEGVDADASDAGFESWTELLLARAEVFQNVEKPSLYAWVLTQALGDGSTVSAERNPYYWKVDPDGRQLPYIDQVTFDVASDAEVILLKATNGELSFHTRHINGLANKPVLADSREAGNYDFVTLQSTFMNEVVVFLNLSHENPAKREVFNNRDFRIGLSHAIDRAEINTAVFQDVGEPWQAAPAPDSKFYNEEFGTQYTEYDVDLANETLDRAGYAERGANGIRLGPDGKPISIEVEVVDPGILPGWLDVANLVVDYWKEVGINARTRPEDRALFAERTEANQHDAGVWVGPGGLGDETRRPFFYLPSLHREQAFAPKWAQWYMSHGAEGEEPPAAARQQFELFWQFAETPDADGRDDLFGQIIQIAQEQFWVIGTVRVPEGYGILSNDFHNVPETMPESFDFATPGGTNPCQYFVES